MKRVEKEIIKLLSALEKEKIEITASGLVMLFDLDITPREAAWVLKKLATQIVKDTYFNQNVYVINIQKFEVSQEG